ncbi:MAG: hypothetical protein WCT52_04290 [Candidatus Micrarchaeia archaeon]
MNIRTVFHSPMLREKALLARQFFGKKLLDEKIMLARKERAAFLKLREAKFRLNICRKAYCINGYHLETEPEKVRNTKCGFSPRERARAGYKTDEQKHMHDLAFQYIELGKLVESKKSLAKAYYVKAARIMLESDKVLLYKNDFNSLECVSTARLFVKLALKLGGDLKLVRLEGRLYERQKALSDSTRRARADEPIRAGFPPDWKNPGYSWEKFEPVI